MVDRPITLPTNLGDDVWSRVHQMRSGDRVRPVRDHNRNQREDQEADRRDRFEGHPPVEEHEEHKDASSEGDTPSRPEQLVLRFMRDLPLEAAADAQANRAIRLPGMGKNLDLQA